MAISQKTADFFAATRILEKNQADPDALFELGTLFSTGAEGIEIDLIEAHKWFNLAALNGSSAAQACRAEIADDMSAREIAEAQRQARAWLAATVRRAA